MTGHFLGVGLGLEFRIGLRLEYRYPVCIMVGYWFRGRVRDKIEVL